MIACYLWSNHSSPCVVKSGELFSIDLNCEFIVAHYDNKLYYSATFDKYLPTTTYQTSNMFHNTRHLNSKVLLKYINCGQDNIFYIIDNMWLVLEKYILAIERILFDLLEMQYTSFTEIRIIDLFTIHKSMFTIGWIDSFAIYLAVT